MSLILAALLMAAGKPPHVKPVDAVDFKRDEVRRIGAHFGKCVVAKKPDLARSYVLREDKPVKTVNDAVEHIKATEKLKIGDCLFRASDSGGGQMGMSFRGDAMRFVLADALVRRHFGKLPPLNNLDRIPPLPRHSVVMEELGECVVRRDPHGAHTLLGTRVVTPEESSAFTALKPAIAACLPMTATVRLDKEMLRGLVAYSYLRLGTATPAATASAAK